MIYHNRVDCEVMCGLLGRLRQVKLRSVMNVLCVTPFPYKSVK